MECGEGGVTGEVDEEISTSLFQVKILAKVKTNLTYFREETDEVFVLIKRFVVVAAHEDAIS